MLEMRIYDKETEEFKNININASQVEVFGIYNKKLWNKNGTFKKFEKIAYVDIKETGKIFTSYHTDIIKELKVVLMGGFKMTKDNDYEYKNYAERKCTNWKYQIETL